MGNLHNCEWDSVPRGTICGYNLPNTIIFNFVPRGTKLIHHTQENCLNGIYCSTWNTLTANLNCNVPRGTHDIISTIKLFHVEHANITR